MVYRSYEDLSNCIRRNLWKVPQDIDLIVGVPRSGMIPALMLAELMNIRCADIDAFAEGREMSCGGRQKLMASQALKEDGKKKVLVLDDTVLAGSAMRKARERLAPLEEMCDIIYGCVYAEGKNAKEMVDLWLEDIWQPGEKVWLYEWNVPRQRQLYQICGLKYESGRGLNSFPNFHSFAMNCWGERPVRCLNWRLK